MEEHSTKIHVAILIVSMALFVLLLTRFLREAAPPEHDLHPAVMVEVKGDVSRPGIYALDEAAATVAGAAAMAGCPWKVPATVAFQKLASGQSLEILRQGETITTRLGRMPGPALLACGLKLDLNSASLDEFVLIPQMRADIAAAIIERRREKAWEKVDDLIEIRGVGPKTVQRLRDYLEISADTNR